MDDLHLPKRGEESLVIPGVTIARGSLGAISVKGHGNVIGWLHASINGQWNAYLRTDVFVGGTHLGRFTLLEAVTRIAEAARVHVA